MKKRILILLTALCLFITCAANAENTEGDNVRNWYEIFVRSYKDSDGDGIGDLRGVIEKLEYIEDMGYNGIWLMPIMPSPSYHKYDVTDYKAIDPQYGTMEDFRELVAQCHARDIKLIIDMVLNHSSSQHPWFVAACDALRAGDVENLYVGYYCFQQKEAQKYIPVSGTQWYYEEQFSGGGMPDLNLDSEAVFAEIRDIFAFWLCDVGVDGFRLDAVTSYYTGDVDRNVAFLAKIKALAEELRPGSYLVGEAWTGLTEIARYYESGVDSFFLFPASQAEGYICRALLARSKNAASYQSALEKVYAALPGRLLAPFIGNHDTGRAVGSLQARKNTGRAKFAEALVNMMGGAAFTYYGEEIGMVGAGDDPNKRLAMYWSDGDMTSQPPGVTKLEYAYPSVEAQLADENSLLAYCRALNHLKLAHPAIARGETEFVYSDDYLLVLRRAWGEECCYIALNFDTKNERSAKIGVSGLKLSGWLNAMQPQDIPAASLNGSEIVIAPYGVGVFVEGM